jgi:hypothetical protein
MVTEVREPQIGEFPFTGELETAVRTLKHWKEQYQDFAADNPLEALVALVTGSAFLLYQVEKDVNEGIQTYDDALYYISTCLCVGYANVFPMTQAGKFIAAVVMMLGPSLSAWVLEGRLVRRQGEAAQALPGAPAAPAPDMGPVLEKLEAILVELRALREHETPRNRDCEGADPPAHHAGEARRAAEEAN